MAPKKQLFGDRNFVASSAIIDSIMVHLSSKSNSKSEEDRVIQPRKYGELRRQEMGVPRSCDCGAKVLVQTSNEQPTRGMQFLHCPYEISRGLGEGCGFMRDWNEAIQDEFDKVREHNAALKKALEEAIEKIEDLDIRVSASEDDGTLEHAVKDVNWKLQVMKEKYEEAIDKIEDLDIRLTEKHEEAIDKIEDLDIRLAEKHEELAAKLKS